jgi:hypothetical protein
MIQGKTRRPIRVQDSGSHGSMGPPAGATYLGQGRRTQNRHLGPLTSPSAEAEVGWGSGPVGRPAWSAKHGSAPPTYLLDVALPY